MNEGSREEFKFELELEFSCCFFESCCKFFSDKGERCEATSRVVVALFANAFLFSIFHLDSPSRPALIRSSPAPLQLLIASFSLSSFGLFVILTFFGAAQHFKLLLFLSLRSTTN